MRIISEFKDYYDCIQKYGQDRTMVYLRNPEKFKYGSKNTNPLKTGGRLWPFPNILSYYRDLVSFEQYIIGFCGKIYPVLQIWKFNDHVNCHSIEDIDKYIEGKFKKKQIEGYYASNKDKKRRSWDGKNRDIYKNFFDECKKVQNDYENIFIESHHPIFVANHKGRWYNYETSTITFNAMLREFDFFRIMPVDIAYQEIQMYFGGVLGQGNPSIPDVSNDDLIESKGFDLKKSFRKDKKEKK